ncbi:MAG TPA: terminase TerL endonuclease subunit [Acidimicrobiales bacterium]|nr:terminase TerL endonuclease subunit [Acidimicrobiales bacterium]
MLDAFERFAGLLTTENGSPMVLEAWQKDVIEDIFTARESLLMLPKGNGKTAFMAAVAAWHLVTTPNAQCYVAAASRDQATLLYGYLHGFIVRSPDLQERLLARPGYREIRRRRKDDLGFLKVLASDADTADGVAPTLALVDELHRHKNGDLYAALRDGLGKRGGQLVTISTAGWDEQNSTLGQLRRAALTLPDIERQGAHVRAAGGGFVLHEWAVPTAADADDLGVVKQANPSSFVTLEDLAARHDSPSMARNDWLRFACNIWTAGSEQWIAPEAWDACAADREVPDGAAIIIGFDGSYSGDSTAAVGLLVAEVPHLFMVALWEPRPDAEVDIEDVERVLLEAGQRFKVLEVCADPYRWARSLQILYNRGLPVCNFPQSVSRMSPATARFAAAVGTRSLTHSGDPRLRAHVLNAALVSDSRGQRIQKHSKKSPNRIDAAVCAVMALDRFAQGEDAARELQRQQGRQAHAIY